MSRSRRFAAATAVALGLTLLVSCADETERYCTALEDQQQALTELARAADEPGAEFYPRLLEIWQDLRDEAPDDLADEWSTLVFSLESFLDAVERTGTTPDEFDPENPPPGVDEAAVDAARDAAADLLSPRVVTAAEGVQQHARDVCKTDLGLTGRGEG